MLNFDVVMNMEALMEQAAAAECRYQYAEAVQLYTAVLNQTKQLPQDTAVIAIRHQALLNRALMQRRLGQQEAALEGYQQMRREAQTPQQTLLAFTMLGQQYSNMGQHKQALELHRQAMQIAESLNDTRGRALTLYGMGTTQFYTAHYDEAVANFTKSRSLYQQLNLQLEESRSWNMSGLAYLRMGAVDKAINALEQALALIRGVGGDFETSVILGNIGECYQGLFAMEEAIANHREALQLAEPIGIPSFIMDLQRNLGIELVYMGQVDEGIDLLNRSFMVSEAVGQQDLTLQLLYSLAMAEKQRHQISAAEAYAFRLCELAEESGDRGHHCQALHVLGLCAQAKGDAVQAEQLWQQALFLAHETGQQGLLWQLHASLAEISANPALALTHYRIAAEVLEQIVYPIEDKEVREKFLSAAPVRHIFSQIK
jgi:tetratricopeptide (TPR) repeat protein